MKPIHKTERSAEDAARYNNTDLYDVHRISDFPEVKSLLRSIYAEMDAEGLVPRYPKKAKQFRDTLRLTVLNLCAVYLNDPHKYVAYHRNKNEFRKGTRYHTFGISYHSLIETIIDRYLMPREYVEGPKGVWFSDNKRISRMRPTKKFVERFIEVSRVTLPMIQYDDRRELIVLRDSEKQDLEYQDTDFTLKSRDNLKLINRVFDQNVILLALSNQDLALMNQMLMASRDKVRRLGGAIDFTRTRLRRIFNNSSWEQGGRYYGGWWQRIPNRRIKFRQHITINGMPTVEPDFSGLHINMLYAWEGIPMPEDDVYKLEGYSNDDTFRAFVKRMLLVMVNAANPKEVRAVLHQEVFKDGSLKLPEEIGSTKAVDIDPVKRAFEEKHAAISRYFSTGKGVDLQYWDSVLAEYIMVHFARQGVPCLPVHDSFIIDFRLEDELIRVMKEGFKALFGQECNLGIKPTKGVYDLDWAFAHIVKWMSGAYSDEDAERDEMWLNTHFSRYNQLLREFADAKGIELEEPEIRKMPPEVMVQFRQKVEHLKAHRQERAARNIPLRPLADRNEKPDRIKMVTPTAMKQFKLIRDHLISTGSAKE